MQNAIKSVKLKFRIKLIRWWNIKLQWTWYRTQVELLRWGSRERGFCQKLRLIWLLCIKYWSLVQVHQVCKSSVYQGLLSARQSFILFRWRHYMLNLQHTRDFTFICYNNKIILCSQEVLQDLKKIKKYTFMLLIYIISIILRLRGVIYNYNNYKYK